MFNTPILFLIFNRPDTTIQVFEQIRKIQPRQLFIAADGPRDYKDREREKCELVRKMVLEGIDWDCEVYTQFRSENLGCGLGPATAITWFFESVEAGIILEDDTVPNMSFFSFCESLLDFYKDDERVMHIGGTSFLFKKKSSRTYYYSRYPNIWGWASWARAWKHYIFNLNSINQLKDVISFDTLDFTNKERKYWENCFPYVKSNLDNIWDYQWFFTIWKNNGFCITPYMNMVTNIGFGPDGTHTHSKEWKIANMAVFEVNLPLRYPKKLAINKKNDYYTFRTVYCVPTSFANKLRNFTYKFIPYEKRKRYLGI